MDKTGADQTSNIVMDGITNKAIATTDEIDVDDVLHNVENSTNTKSDETIAE